MDLVVCATCGRQIDQVKVASSDISRKWDVAVDVAAQVRSLGDADVANQLAALRAHDGRLLDPRHAPERDCQNWLKNVHTSMGIHDLLCPESVGCGVWPPSYEHQRTGRPAGHPM